MKENYFVLYKRDRDAEKMKRCRGRMLYDRIKEANMLEEATRFGLSRLQDTPIVAKAVTLISDYRADANYVVAAYFTSKYQSHSYDGSSSDIPTHEVVRCRQENLDAVVESMASEGPSRMYLGIEEKLVPSALDVIKECE